MLVKTEVYFCRCILLETKTTRLALLIVLWSRMVHSPIASEAGTLFFRDVNAYAATRSDGVEWMHHAPHFCPFHTAFRHFLSCCTVYWQTESIAW